MAVETTQLTLHFDGTCSDRRDILELPPEVRLVVILMACGQSLADVAVVIDTPAAVVRGRFKRALFLLGLPRAERLQLVASWNLDPATIRQHWKQILVVRHLQGWSIAELALVTGRTAGVLRETLRRALRLRQGPQGLPPPPGW